METCEKLEFLGAPQPKDEVAGFARYGMWSSVRESLTQSASKAALCDCHMKHRAGVCIVLISHVWITLARCYCLNAQYLVDITSVI